MNTETEKYKLNYNELYSNDVCSIDQMNELEALGIDTSDASCMWTSIQDKDYNPISWLPVFRGEDRVTIDVLKIKFPLTYKEGNVYYCYTLGDLIKKLPDCLDDYELRISNGAVWYESTLNGSISNDLVCFTEEKLISSVFNMIKWLKLNNYENI